MTKETRVFDADFEVRSEGDSTVIEGHAAVFERESQDLGGFVERCAPGAFAATLGDDVRALINHDPNLVLGRTTAGTLSLTEDSTGLLFRNTLPGTSYARDLAISLGRGDISQCSFSFAVNEEDWGYNTQDIPLRTLRSVKLFDVGPVTFPAYLATDVAFARSMMPKRTVVTPDAALRMRLDLMRRVLGQ